MVVQPLSLFGQMGASGLARYGDHLLLTSRIEHNQTLKGHCANIALITSLEGSLKLKVNGFGYALGLSSFIVVNRGSLLSFEHMEANCQPVLLFFRNVVADVAAAELFYKEPGNTKDLSFDQLKDHSLIEHIHYANTSLQEQLRLLIDLSESCASFHALKADAIVRSLIKDLVSENHQAISVSSKIPVVKQSTKVDLYKRLTMAKDWMQENLHNGIVLDDASEVAMMTKEHFLRNFKKAFDSTPHQYLMGLRMERAKTLLLESSMPAQEISEMIGFETLSSFSYQFRKSVGITPSDFRKHKFPD